MSFESTTQERRIFKNKNSRFLLAGVSKHNNHENNLILGYPGFQDKLRHFTAGFHRDN
jgi:hypothetical protein